jgi:CTD kinase subunit beta
MAPAEEEARIGPHPSFIEVANKYILQSRIQKCLDSIGMSEAQDNQVRLRGVEWIDAVRRSLSLPIRTFATAVSYYHRFRLKHADNEYNWADASAAALFTACKIEDTLKKSREILCASWNLKLPSSEHISPDDPVSRSAQTGRTELTQTSVSSFRPRTLSASSASCLNALALTSAAATPRS